MNSALLVCLSAVFTTVNGHYFSFLLSCQSQEPDQQVEFILLLMYNKVKFLTFNSTEKQFVGYSYNGRKWADDLNKQTVRIAEGTKNGLDECHAYGKLFLPLFQTAVRPEVSVRLLSSASAGQSAVLLCSAYDYYPKQIKVWWLINGAEASPSLISSEELSDGDWYYQIHSHLHYTPSPGEQISCVVEHDSFKQPMVYRWDPSLPASERCLITFGAVGFALGLITAAAAFIHYRRKSKGWTFLPGMELESSSAQ